MSYFVPIATAATVYAVGVWATVFTWNLFDFSALLLARSRGLGWGLAWPFFWTFFFVIVLLAFLIEGVSILGKTVVRLAPWVDPIKLGESVRYWWVDRSSKPSH